MRTCVTRSLFLAAIVAALPAIAQTSAPVGAQEEAARHADADPLRTGPERGSFVRTVVADEWHIWSSPFRKTSYSSPAVKKYVIPFALVATALVATDHKTSEALPNTADQTIWSERISRLGAVYTLAGGAGATYLAGALTGNKRAKETGWLGLQAIAHAQVVVFGLKQITNRERPANNPGGVGFWKGGDSFPSGHAMTSFALATVVAYEYHDHIAAPITAYTIATLISASRVSARRHWVSDVFVGGSAGFLIGRYVYKRHHDPELAKMHHKRGRTARLVPTIGFDLNGPTLSWCFGE